MSGLVDELQADAMNKSVPVATLLRKVKVAAVKLGLDDAVAWVDAELNGYEGDLPDYRTGRGSTIAWNPMRGWVPFYCTDPKTAELISQFPMPEPIANYEAILEREGDILHELPDRLVAAFNKDFSFTVPRMANKVPRGTVVGLVEQVRNMVLDWALELERAGVTGAGLSFTREERERASGAQIHIGEFHGSFNAGDAIGANPRINQGSTDNSTNLAADHSIFGEIEQAVRTHVADPVFREEILAANREMQSASDRSSLLSAYNRFLASAADYMGVLLPLLPALTAIVMGGGA